MCVCRLIARVSGVAAFVLALMSGPVLADTLTDGRFPEDVVAAQRREIAAFLAGLVPEGGNPGCCAPTTYAEVGPRLRVQLVPHQVIRDHPEFARRPFSDTLNVVYVIDEPHRYQYVTRDMLSGWHVDMARVEALAVKNLAEASQNVPADLALDGDKPAYLLAHAGDDYDAARLMVPSYLETLRQSLKADAIVLAAPTRGLLMAWPLESRTRAAFAVAVTTLTKEGPDSRSDELFRFDRAGLRPLNAAERADHGR